MHAIIKYRGDDEIETNSNNIDVEFIRNFKVDATTLVKNQVIGSNEFIKFTKNSNNVVRSEHVKKESQPPSMAHKSILNAQRSSRRAKSKISFITS